MRLIQFIPAAVILTLMAMSAFAQEPAQYVNRRDFFTIDFPTEPKLEEFTYVTEYDTKVPARRYTAEANGTRYSVTVVDFTHSSVIQKRVRLERAGAVAHAATELRQKGKVTYDAYGEIDVIPGHQLQITEPDGRRLFAQILMHEGRLYVVEASAPQGGRPPSAFQQSLTIIDSDGKEIRYNEDGTRQRPNER